MIIPSDINGGLNVLSDKITCCNSLNASTNQHDYHLYELMKENREVTEGKSESGIEELKDRLTQELEDIMFVS